VIAFLSNTAHVHLLLNHVPTTLFAAALVVFVIALATKNDTLTKTSLAGFFLVAAVTIATYTSGSAAEAMLRGMGTSSELPPDVLSDAIHMHEDAALWASILMGLTGFFSWLALWQGRSVKGRPAWSLPVVLVLALASFAAMSRTAVLGGRISHVEVRDEVVARHNACLALVDEEVKHPGTVPNAPESCPWQAAVDEVAKAAGPSQPYVSTSRELGDFVIGHTWMWPTLETLHFVGLCLLFTAVLIVNLRLLGMITVVPYSAVYQLLPIGMVGFAINLVTGMLFFVGIPTQYNANPVFYWKIAFVLLGGLNATYFLLVDDTWRVESGVAAPLSAKLAAGSAIFIWVAVLYCGHMLPFIGNAF
jgi:uncharacterized membrane protein